MLWVVFRPYLLMSLMRALLPQMRVIALNVPFVLQSKSHIHGSFNNVRNAEANPKKAFCPNPTHKTTAGRPKISLMFSKLSTSMFRLFFIWEFIFVRLGDFSSAFRLGLIDRPRGRILAQSWPAGGGKKKMFRC